MMVSLYGSVTLWSSAAVFLRFYELPVLLATLPIVFMPNLHDRHNRTLIAWPRRQQVASAVTH